LPHTLHGPRAHSEAHTDHSHTAHPPPAACSARLHRASLTNIARACARLSMYYFERLRPLHGGRQGRCKRSDLKSLGCARERRSNARPLSPPIARTRSARPRIRSVTTPVCDRYERPPLAGVGSAPVACCCGCAAGQLAACLPRQWSVHAPSCAVPARRLRGEAVVGRRFGRQVVGPACSGAVHASYAYCARWSWPWLAAGDLRRVSGGRDTQP